MDLYDEGLEVPALELSPIDLPEEMNNDINNELRRHYLFTKDLINSALDTIRMEYVDDKSLKTLCGPEDVRAADYTRDVLKNNAAITEALFEQAEESGIVPLQMPPPYLQRLNYLLIDWPVPAYQDVQEQAEAVVDLEADLADHEGADAQEQAVAVADLEADLADDEGTDAQDQAEAMVDLEDEDADDDLTEKDGTEMGHVDGDSDDDDAEMYHDDEDADDDLTEEEGAVRDDADDEDGDDDLAEKKDVADDDDLAEVGAEDDVAAEGDGEYLEKSCPRWCFALLATAAAGAALLAWFLL